MSSNRSERLRQSALECLNLARATSDLRARRTLLCMVEVWTKLLEQRVPGSDMDGLVDMLDTVTVLRDADEALALI